MESKLNKLQINVSKLYLSRCKKEYTNFTDLYNYICNDLRIRHIRLYHNLQEISKMINPDLIRFLNLKFRNNALLFLYSSIVRLYNSKVIYMDHTDLYKYVSYITADLYVLIKLYYNNPCFKRDLMCNYNFVLFRKKFKDI